MSRKRKYLTINLYNIEVMIGRRLARGEFEEVEGIKGVVPESFLNKDHIEEVRKEYSEYYKRLEEEELKKEGALS